MSIKKAHNAPKNLTPQRCYVRAIDSRHGGTGVIGGSHLIHTNEKKQCTTYLHRDQKSQFPARSDSPIVKSAMQLPALGKPGMKDQDPDQTEEGRVYRYIEQNYAAIRLIRTAGVIKKSWASSDKCGYSWACVLPLLDKNKNAVTFHGYGPSGQFDIKVLLAIGAGRFKGNRGSIAGDLYFRIDVTAPFEDCGFGPKDHHPNWKNFIIPGSFDLSDEQKVRRGIAIEPRESSAPSSNRATELATVQQPVFGIAQTTPPQFQPPAPTLHVEKSDKAVAPIATSPVATSPVAGYSRMAQTATVPETDQQMELRLESAELHRLVQKHLAILETEMEKRRAAREAAVMERLDKKARDFAIQQMKAKYPGEEF